MSLCTYECRLVPGPLQSEGYARALIENRIPLFTDEQLEAQVTAREERQRMLHECPTVPFHFIVEEAVLRRRLGGIAAQREQLNQVLEHAVPRNVTLQIVPLEAEYHSCTDGPLRLLETPEGKRLAYSEGQKSGRLIADPKEVAWTLGACASSGAQRHFYVRSSSAPPAPCASAPARRAAPANASRAARCAASALRPVRVRASQVRGRLPK